MPTKKLENNTGFFTNFSVLFNSSVFYIKPCAKNKSLPVSYDVLASKLFTKMHGFLLITSQKVAD